MKVDKEVLDVCCGGKLFYFDPAAPYLLTNDVRKGKYDIGGGRTVRVEPDTQHDFRHMPFPDESFRLVIFDPPHLRWCGEKSFMYKKYGRLPSEWKDYISEGFGEAWRVLKPGGTLIFKWSSYQVKTTTVLKTLSMKPLFGTKHGGHTWWFVFYKSGVRQELENE